MTALPVLDLHVHSNHSDGKYDPTEVLRLAATGGITVLAIADHDLAPALRPGVHEVEGRAIRVLAAAEVSGAHEGEELHLLVYFPGEPPPEAVAFLRQRAVGRAQRFNEAAARLALPDRAPPAAVAGEQSLTRFHLAAALAESGRVKRPSDAWPHLQRDNVPLIDFTFLEAIRLARSWGALTSWAHPALADANRFLPAFVAAGLQGLEVCRPGLPKPTKNGLRRLAKRFNLLTTGGSDFHGWWPGKLGDFRFEGEQAQAFLSRLDA
jgi:3',5'-nucleoside bisphosphate phosphatase